MVCQAVCLVSINNKKVITAFSPRFLIMIQNVLTPVYIIVINPDSRLLNTDYYLAGWPSGLTISLLA